jgi:hypothetical protein
MKNVVLMMALMMMTKVNESGGTFLWLSPGLRRCRLAVLKMGGVRRAAAASFARGCVVLLCM